MVHTPSHDVVYARVRRTVWMAVAAVFCAAAPQPVRAFGENTPGLFLERKTTNPGGMLRPKGKKASQHANEAPVVLIADEMGYDQEHGIVVARGHVEIEQGGAMLFAEQVTYFQKRGLVVAEGNVSALQPSGDVIFSERAELNEALKTGVIDAFRARLSDDSVLVAKRAHKVSDTLTTLDKVAYTPCDICETIAPFWQLSANDVRIDQRDESVVYHDATLEFGGVPVFYSPYLSHPTPDAEARSGFAAPQYGANGNLGTFVRVPYYWRIDHDKDITLTPWYTTTEGAVLQGDYRQLTDRGEYNFQGSATNPERLDNSGAAIGGNELRGHLFARGSEAIGEQSQVGFDIKRTTDDTFLRRYGLGDQRVLFSRLFAETADGRNMAMVQGLAIQGLRATDNADTTPFVVPAVQAYYETRPNRWGLRYHVAGDLQSLTRDEGVSQRRASFTTGASLPYVTSGGHILTSTVNVRQDVYQNEDLKINGVVRGDSATALRTLPQLAVEWRYPLIQRFSPGTMTVEPLVLAVAQSQGGNPADISNEDSRLLELTDTNIFALNRVAGLDVVDSGSRVAYGGRAQYLFNDGTSFDGLLGQSFNNDKSTPFPNSTEAGSNYSDYIGRLAYQVDPVRLAYRFALDKSGFTPHRNEFSFAFSRPWFWAMTSYRSLTNNRFLNDSQEGQLDAGLPLNENWSIRAGTRRNFELDKFVTASSGITYKNECFHIGLDAVRVFTQDRDVEPVTQFMLRIALKNLGEFGGLGGSIGGVQ